MVITMNKRRWTSRYAKRGDIVTINIDLVPENGFVPEPLFDTKGTIQFVLGWGNYLPGVHALVEGCAVGDKVMNVSIDAGWGARRSDLIFRVPLVKLQDVPSCPKLEPGETTLKLRGGIEVLVVEIKDGIVVLDANPPLAGTSFSCSFTVNAIDSLPLLDYVDNENEVNSRYQAASFGLGCFWGGELRFMRVPGVVGTKVGYSQGITKDPSYEQVCTGHTKHRESVMVIYDSTKVSYRELLMVAHERLKTISEPNFEIPRLFEEGSEQYRYGFYYHSEGQRKLAKDFLSDSRRCGGDVEILQAQIFYDAEEMMQQYLYKGGQSARKGAKEEIRCYG